MLLFILPGQTLVIKKQIKSPSHKTSTPTPPSKKPNQPLPQLPPTNQTHTYVRAHRDKSFPRTTRKTYKTEPPPPEYPVVEAAEAVPVLVLGRGGGGGRPALYVTGSPCCRRLGAQRARGYFSSPPAQRQPPPRPVPCIAESVCFYLLNRLLLRSVKTFCVCK